jgi:hypothetical protein
VTELDEYIPLGAIRADPERNVARGGRCYPPEHPEVRRQAREIERRDHVAPVGLRPLDAPVLRPCGSKVCCSDEMMERDETSEHRYELVYGYVRYVAAAYVCRRQALRTTQPNVEVCISDSISDAEAMERNIAENVVRAQQTDVEFARAMARLREVSGKDVVEIARAVGARSVREVEDAITIIERCPADVIEEWERRQVRELRAILVRVSRLDPQEHWDVDKRHARMRELWRSEVDHFDAQPPGYQPAGAPGRRGGRDPRDEALRPPRPLSRGRLESLLGRVALAREVYDDRTEAYRPLTDGERAAVRAALRFAADPSGRDPPVR